MTVAENYDAYSLLPLREKVASSVMVALVATIHVFARRWRS